MTIANASNLADQTITSIAAAQSGISTAMTNLNNVLSGFSFSSYSGVSTTGIYVDPYTLFPDADSVIKTALANFDTSVAAITFPTLPDLETLPTGAEAAWTETGWADLKTMLTAFTSNITSADDVDSVLAKLTSDTDRVSSAMFQKGLGRRQQLLRDEISAAATMTGNSGFTYPNCMTQAFMTQALQRFNLGLSDESLKLVDKLFEWAKVNFQFAAEKQIAAHSADTDFNIRYAGVLISAYSEKVKGLLQQYKEEMAGIFDKAAEVMKAYTVRLEVAKGNALIQSEADKHNLAVYTAQVQESVAAFKMITDQIMTVKTQQITAAASAVTAAATMAQAANQVAVGVLNG